MMCYHSMSFFVVLIQGYRERRDKHLNLLYGREKCNILRMLKNIGIFVQKDFTMQWKKKL